MDNRTRFLRTMRFEPVDHPPLMLSGPWGQTVQRWEREGLPAGCNLHEFFGLEPLDMVPVGIETILYPAFKERVLEDTGTYVIKINQRGVKERNFRDGSSMPEFLDYPIKGPQDAGWLAERLDPESAGRVRPDWLEEGRRRQARDALVFCNGGMYFAFLNEHMGTEPLMYTYFDNPEFVHLVNDRLCALCERALTTVLPSFRLDFIGYHEDMAYKNGSIISAEMFREFMTPYYRRIQRIARQFDVELNYMDSDGDIRELIPLWLDCGINTFAPLEVAAGMDVVALRAQYGKQVRMIGGFDKRILATGKAQILRELERVRPVIEGGGYIPGCDHGVPPDVSFENYCCFTNGLKTIYGMA